MFVAPTKPLVAQQIDACHRTCGIPGCDAVELTGNNPRAYRCRMVCISSTRSMFKLTRIFVVGGETDILHDTTDPHQ